MIRIISRRFLIYMSDCLDETRDNIENSNQLKHISNLENITYNILIQALYCTHCIPLKGAKRQSVASGKSTKVYTPLNCKTVLAPFHAEQTPPSSSSRGSRNPRSSGPAWGTPGHYNTHTHNTIVTIETITHMVGSENFSIASVCLWRSVTWLHVSSRGRSCTVL